MLASLAQLLDNNNNHSSSAMVVVDLHSGKMVAGDAVTQLEGSQEVGVVNNIKICAHQLPLPQEIVNRLRRLVSEVTDVDICLDTYIIRVDMCRYL